MKRVKNYCLLEDGAWYLDHDVYCDDCILYCHDKIIKFSNNIEEVKNDIY